MSQQRPTSRQRYLRRIWPVWAGYLAVLLGSKALLERFELAQPITYLIAVAPAVPLAAVVLLVAQLMYGKEDEFQRALWVEALLWGAAITMIATTVWGFLETVGAPSIRLYWVFPFFTAAALCCVPFLARKYE